MAYQIISPWVGPMASSELQVATCHAPGKNLGEVACCKPRSARRSPDDTGDLPAEMSGDGSWESWCCRAAGEIDQGLAG